MLIECKRKRAGGTRVNLGKKTYHFKPDETAGEDAPHVAEVENTGHANTLLGIPAYVLVGNDADADEDDDSGEGGGDQGAAGQTGGDEGQTGPDEPTEGVPYEDMTHEQLIEAHVDVFGQPAHPSAKPETLRKKLIAKRDGTEA